MNRNALIAGCCVFLASCGGGGGGGGGGGAGTSSSTSGSTSSSSPSTAYPSPSTTNGVLNPTASSQSSEMSQSLTVVGSIQNLTGDTTSNRSVTGLNSSFNFNYNSSSRLYEVNDGTGSATFNANTPTTQTIPPDYYPRVEFQSSSYGSFDDLIIFRQCNCTPAIANIYSAYGVWEHNQPSGANTSVKLDYFIYGAPTPTGAMPHTGTKTYRVFGTGNYASDPKLYLTQGLETITVNFDTGQVTGDIGLTGTDFLSGGVAGLIDLNVNGSISGNQVDGSAIFNDQRWSGTYHFTFYGPTAEELGVVYSAAQVEANQPAPITTFNGAAVGVTP